MLSLKGESNRTTSFTVKQYSVACVWLIVPTAIVHGRVAQDRIQNCSTCNIVFLQINFMFLTAIIYSLKNSRKKVCYITLNNCKCYFITMLVKKILKLYSWTESLLYYEF